MSRISMKAINHLENKEATGGYSYMRWVCRVDEDQLIMFKTLASLKSLGIRGEM